LTDDYYRYDQPTHTLSGHRRGNRYRLGDPIRVAVVRVDVDRRELDFRVVVRHQRAAAIKRGARSSTRKGKSPRRPFPPIKSTDAKPPRKRKKKAATTKPPRKKKKKTAAQGMPRRKKKKTAVKGVSKQKKKKKKQSTTKTPVRRKKKKKSRRKKKA